MRYTIKITKLLCVMVLLFFNVSFIAIRPAGAMGRVSEEIDYLRYSSNSINMYNSNECFQNNSSSPEISPTQNSNLESVVESYGELAMDLQREWGTPWEVVFAQMVIESNVGEASNSIAAAVAENGYYNWLGITGNGGTYSVHQPYVDSGGRSWAQYASVENMIKDWAGEYIARNGSYDAAFRHLAPNNYQLSKFLEDFIMVYAPPEENDVSSYINMVMGLIEGTIKDVRTNKNWPSSGDLAKEENIGIGGRHPIGGGSNENNEESNGGNRCTLLRESPDYDSSSYQNKVSNLHDFNQRDGTFKDYRLCGDGGDYIATSGCGVMSLYAAYYMFSNSGWNDTERFEEFLSAAQQDGYVSEDCGQSNTFAYGQNLTNVTEMSGETILAEENYSGDHWDMIIDQLKRGNKIIINVIGADGSYFTSGGHYMMFDHYNEEKDKVFLFDPYLNEGTISRLDNDLSSSDIEYDNFRDGIYLSRSAVDRVVKPRRALILTYNGCYDGSTSVCSSKSGIVSGGMNFEQAKAFMKQYRDEASKRLHGAYGNGFPNGTIIGDGWVNDASWDGTLNNCSAFTQWFVNNYTSAGPGFGSAAGSEFVGLLLSSEEFEDGGQIPQAYAIFSEGAGQGGGDGCYVGDVFHSNHTGVVLGIDEENNIVYTGEASYSNGYTGGSGDYSESEANGIWPGVHIHTLDSMTNSGVGCGFTYAYPKNILINE